MSHEAVTKVGATGGIYLGFHANTAIFQGTGVSLAPKIVKHHKELYNTISPTTTPAIA